MKTVKVAELSGLPLCYTVCMLEKPTLVWGETIGIHYVSHQIVIPSLPAPTCFSPYTNWAMCGPIIERENISLVREGDATEYAASVYNHTLKDWHLFQYHDKPLIAAMRCYVASKLGEEVEIPDELL